MTPDGERRARVALSFLTKPGDPILGAALRTRTASELLALVTGADADGEALLAGEHRTHRQRRSRRYGPQPIGRHRTCAPMRPPARGSACRAARTQRWAGRG